MPCLSSPAPPYGDTSQALIERLRSPSFAEELEVGGRGARFADYQSSIDSRLLVALSLMVGGSLIVLFLVAGSVVLPIKALLLNLLTVGAALGLLVVLVQEGTLADALDFTARDAVDVNLPIFLTAVAFGLSTDYGIILLSRIKEAHDDGLSDPDAIVLGLERVGRVFTAAALLFCIAFGAIGSSPELVVKEIAIGTVLAVLIDATVVRILLVPSLMKLLGRWNWWAPRPLLRMRARLGLS